MNEQTQKILWVDLEMTGLDPYKDRIVEVAAIITDWDFTEYASIESGVGQDTAEVTKLLDTNEWYAKFPENKRTMLGHAQTGPPEKEVVQRLIKLLDDHFAPYEKVVLAGNSIHQDRRFIRKWWPELDARLHYRMLDVSAWKVLMMGKFGVEFKKSEAHRALDDIRESIDELKFYLHYFGKR